MERSIGEIFFGLSFTSRGRNINASQILTFVENFSFLLLLTFLCRGRLFIAEHNLLYVGSRGKRVFFFLTIQVRYILIYVRSHNC